MSTPGGPDGSGPTRQRRFVVWGRVQGVGFRWWIRSHALRLGISGTVRNRPDGAVEVQARGSQPAVDELHGLLREGPPAARVERVEEEPASGVSDEGFGIIR